ncbi:MFS transporter [uncultured Brevibacillus sp.]|uniref:MFS transporter n=1 Tax=uncultured Brevibacillus sp. TaxID=169970 RepID=UPI0025968605|nr:MFS transporter [uncultured Brevibacillus sp.]
MMNVKAYLYVNALSSLGSRMDLIACSALILTFEHSAYWLTAFFVMRQVGGMLFSPFAGMLADRVDRRKAMIASDFGAGLAVLAILIFPNPIVVITAAFLKGMLYTLFHIGFQSSLPQMFGSAQLIKINGLTVRLESIVGIVGFALGGFLTDHFGYSLVIACNAASFLFSALILTRIRWESTITRQVSSAAGDSGEAGSSGLASTLIYLRTQPILLAISILALFESVSTAAHNYGLPFLADQLLAGDATLHGVMWSAMSVGALGGSYLASRLRIPLVTGVLTVSLLTAVVVTFAFAVTDQWIVLLLLAGAGVFAGSAQVYKSTILQQADNQIRGRVMGVQGLLSRMGFFIGFVAAPPLAISFGLFKMMVLAQGVFLLSVICLFSYVKLGKQ